MTGIENSEFNAFRSAIEAQHAALADAFDRGDFEVIGNGVFTEGAWLVGDGDAGTFVGSQAIGNVFADFVGKYRWTSKSVKSGVSGSVGFDFANAVMRAVEGDDVLTFKLLFIWEKVDGKWVATGQMYVTGNYPS